MYLSKYIDLVDGQCGIGRIKCFISDKHYKKLSEWNRNQYIEFTAKNVVATHGGGTGLFGTGFVPTPESEESYEFLTNHFPVVFQTPIRVNANSGYRFFYTMFDTKKELDVQYINPINWPFKEK